MKNYYFIAAAFWLVIGMSIADQILVVPTLSRLLAIIFLALSIPCQVLLLVISLCLFDGIKRRFDALNLWLGKFVRK